MNRYASIFHALRQAEHSLGSPIDRHQLIYGFTKGRTGSLKELSTVELIELRSAIDSLKPYTQRTDLMRKKIISLLTFRGMIKEGKPDMKRIYAWVKKYGYLHKDFNSYSYSELPRLVYQAEQLKYKHIQNA